MTGMSTRESRCSFSDSYAGGAFYGLLMAEAF
jgi:hypothetical protein